MKNFIEQLVELEGAALTLANILCGRFIGQVARGFGDDEEVRAQANLYFAIKAKYGKEVIEVPAMWQKMLSNADDNSAALAGADLTPEEEAEWKAAMGESEADRLRNCAKELLRIGKEEGPKADIKAWYDLTPLAQHSLAVRTERNLFNAIKRYSSWTSEEGARLRQITGDAVEPLAKLVGDLTESLKDDLDQARSNGVNVAQRHVA